MKVAFVGFIIEVLYYKGFIIKKTYTFSVIKLCTDIFIVGKYCKAYIDVATLTIYFLNDFPILFTLIHFYCWKIL